MSSQANNNALALYEILLSISDSLNEAQHQLRNMPPYDQFGRPNTMYQLPYLDFSLEVISELNQASLSTSNDPGSAGDLPDKPVKSSAPFKANKYNDNYYANKLAFRPASTASNANSSSNKITSTISGRFVAIMPNEGLPQVFLTFSAENQGANHKLLVKLQLATGEPVVGQRVEVNFDVENSQALNTNLTGTVQFSPINEGFTNHLGAFETHVAILAASPNQTFVFVANSGTIFKSIALTT